MCPNSHLRHPLKHSKLQSQQPDLQLARRTMRCGSGMLAALTQSPCRRLRQHAVSDLARLPGRTTSAPGQGLRIKRRGGRSTRVERFSFYRYAALADATPTARETESYILAAHDRPIVLFFATAKGWGRLLRKLHQISTVNGPCTEHPDRALRGRNI